MKKFLIIGMTIACLCFPSCATTPTRSFSIYRMYSVPERPKSEIGILYKTEGIVIYRIDGKTPGEYRDKIIINETAYSIDGKTPGEYRDKYEFLPGTYTLEIGYRMTTWDFNIKMTTKSKSHISLSFDVRAGHEYEIRSLFGEGDLINLFSQTWKPYIIDLVTKQVVSQSYKLLPNNGEWTSF
jgi:hypothetical protein